jgi:hypothetical protein
VATKKKVSSKANEPAKAAAPPTGGGSAEDFEKLVVFYLGRPYDMAAKQSKPGWLLYDSKDLVTHAVCVGASLCSRQQSRRRCDTGCDRADLALAVLESSPSDGAQFGAVPSAASKAKSYETWNKDFSSWLFRNQKVDNFKSPSTKEGSRPGESEWDFRVRLQQS